MKQFMLIVVLSVINTGFAASIKPGRCLYQKGQNKAFGIVYEVNGKFVTVGEFGYYVEARAMISKLVVGSKRDVRRAFKVKKCLKGKLWNLM